MEINKMLRMLEKLVNIDSGSYDKEGVDKIGSYLKRLYLDLGYEVIEKKHNEFGNSYIVRYKEAKDPKILILAHMDTVFPKGTVSERPFTIKGERAYGPGVMDMKASQVMLYFAIKELLNNNHTSYKQIEIVLNSDEEIGSVSSKPIIEERAKDKEYVLVLEPARPDGSIVSSRRGVGRYQLEIEGIAAHAGIEPDKGRSAIEELAHKILKIHSLSSGVPNIDVNVGLVEGGTAVNMVAPQAKAYIDARFATEEQGKWIDHKIKDICQTSEVSGTKIKLSGGFSRSPMVLTEKMKKLIEIIQSEGKKLNLDINHVSTGGASDALITAAMNVPTIDGLGPVGGNMFAEDEYTEINSIIERTKLFMNVIDRLVQDKSS